MMGEKNVSYKFIDIICHVPGIVYCRFLKEQSIVQVNTLLLCSVPHKALKWHELSSKTVVSTLCRWKVFGDLISY